MTEGLKIKARIDLVVSMLWLRTVTCWGDFNTACGYWAKTEAFSGSRSARLIREYGTEGNEVTVDEWEQAETLLEPYELPKGWHVLDEAFAVRAFIEGVKRKGVEWYERGDANDHDVAIQRALFGECKYG